MRSTTFDDLPGDVRNAVTEAAGRPTGFTCAEVGNHAEIAGQLRTSTGRAFVKGARLLPGERFGGAEAWSLRNEAAILPHVAGHAPELLWQVETEGWLLLGMEYIEGRHADYRPGSPDLEHVTDAIDALAAAPCPDAVRLRVEDRYTSLDPEAVALAGDHLLHCDLNPSNVLITGAGARVVDWAFTSRGAAWLEPAFVLPWLIRDGHTPAQAEAWARRSASWAAADPRHIDLFTRLLAQAWTRRDIDGAPEWVREYAAIARRLATVAVR